MDKAIEKELEVVANRYSLGSPDLCHFVDFKEGARWMHEHMQEKHRPLVDAAWVLDRYLGAQRIQPVSNDHPISIFRKALADFKGEK